MSAVAPGAWLGLMGGGQLGRMFSMAAQSMGFKVLVVDPAAGGPAASVADDHVQADYLDDGALAELSRRCAAVTTEFENVPADALRRLAADCVVSPGHDSVAVAQDRIREKHFLVSAGLGTAPFAVIEREDDLDRVDATLFPAILKSARLGYDGKGQASVGDAAAAREAFARLGGRPCVLEKRLELDIEVSVVVARGFDGSVVTFPVAENRHSGGILDVSIVPARIPDEVASAARSAALRVAERLEYVGVLCVEFFLLRDGRLLANEIAPRPHNSGHYTIDACLSSQFEQQTRIMCRLPLGSTDLHCPAVMVNLLGDLWQAGEPDWTAVLRHPRAKLHLYGKQHARPGRKMGHFTVLGVSAREALAVAEQIRADLQAGARRAA
ncbi:MAG: 5-(carboxyamino)imidazole ribonucleotide synthase [Betaproteobacteria bacterium]|nr:5-(carboxyamino)imidazole ribonucleotide synthase [Betaproteobacteria bacterium]